MLAARVDPDDRVAADGRGRLIATHGRDRELMSRGGGGDGAAGARTLGYGAAQQNREGQCEGTQAGEGLASHGCMLLG